MKNQIKLDRKMFLFINRISHLGNPHKVTTLCMNYDITKKDASRILSEYNEIKEKKIDNKKESE